MKPGIRKILLVLLFFLVVIFMAAGPRQNIKTVDLGNKFAGASSMHWFGTDNLGRDVYSLVAAGGLRTLEVTAIAVSISFLSGCLLGMAGAFWGGILRSVVQFVSDFFLIIPSFILALVFSAVFGFSPLLIGIVLGIGNMGDYINQSLDLSLSLIKEDFIISEKIIGARKLRIMFLHVLPNIAGQLLVFLGNRAGSMVIQYAGLAYIGLGTDYTNPDWGALLYQYRPFLIRHPLLVLWPAGAICLLTVFFHLLFDSGKKTKRSVISYE